MIGAVVCDLDGVVYRGQTATPGAKEALQNLDGAGLAPFFVTNNSAGEPTDVQRKLAEVVGYRTDVDRIVTSAQVAVSLVNAGPVLVVGEAGIINALGDAGLPVTDEPTEAATVIVGLARNLDYQRVARAADAIRAGARLIVTNRDPTFPVEGGLLPGAGACAAAVEVAAGVTGVTAGKPTAAMRSVIESRVSDGDIWMIGDRPDTDIALASGPRWHSILVMTGVTDSTEDLDPEPDHVVADLTEAVALILPASRA